MKGRAPNPLPEGEGNRREAVVEGASPGGSRRGQPPLHQPAAGPPPRAGEDRSALYLWLTLLAALVAFAILRPVDHDESQYVAAAVLSAHGLMPYRDYAYLQTPLQPMLLAPLTALLGGWAWPGLRIVNALLAALAVAGTYRATRAGGVAKRVALAAAGLFAACDILLFAAGTARNDALPAACLAGALWLAMRPATRNRALLTGLLLAGATAAKLSYALPALAYGLATLVDRQRRPALLLAGALPMAALVGWTAYGAPEAFRFDVLTFPTTAPAEFYAGASKLSIPGRLLDAAKFLALGPALLALALVTKRRQVGWLDLLIVAGLVAGLLPSPTWRQYWLPMLPPLFVRLAVLWEEHAPPTTVRVAAGLFAAIGLAPSLIGAAHGPGLLAALHQSRAIRAALDRAHETGPVATLAPEFLPATYRLPDPRFATGPFYFRSLALLDAAAEARVHVVSRARLDTGLAVRPEAVLVGGEARWTSGDVALDAALEHWAVTHGYRAVPVAGARFRLYVDPRVSSSR